MTKRGLVRCEKRWSVVIPGLVSGRPALPDRPGDCPRARNPGTPTLETKGLACVHGFRGLALQGHPGTTAEFCRTVLISRMRRVVLAIAIVTAVLPFSVRAANEVFASIGTAQLIGIYYQVGGAICEIVNQDLRTHGVRCSPETTPGSVYNIQALQSGELEFAIVQSDVQYAAYTGEGPWIGRAFRALRSVMSLYPELVTVIVRADSHIHNLPDLAGRRVNVGSQGSGTLATWEAIESAVGWPNGKRVHPVELPESAATSALCSGEIDASVMIVGHPSLRVTAQQAACPINFAAISGPVVDKLVHDHPYYQTGTIGGAAYGIAAEAPTFGVRATLVTSASVDARVVAVMAKESFTHLPELRALHPGLAGLTAGEMIKDGLTAPLHPGAAQVYKELELR